MSDEHAPRKVDKAHVSILKNVTSNWAALGTGILVSFFLAPFVVHSLGNVYYGIWALLSEFTGYLWLLDFGVRESVIKFVAQYHANDRRDELVETVNGALYLYSGVALVTLAVVGVMMFLLPYIFNIPPESVGTARITLLLTGGTIALSFVFNVFVGVLMGLQRFYLVSRMGILFSLLRALLTVLVLKAGQGIVALAAVNLGISVIVNFIVLRFTRVHLPFYKPRLHLPARSTLAQIVGYAKYVVAHNVGEKIVFATDSIVIGVFLPVAMLTFWVIPGSLIKYLRSMMLMMAAVLNPLSSALDARDDRARLRSLFLDASRASVVIGLPICIGFIVLGTRFVGLWMGPSFASLSGKVLALLGVAQMAGLATHSFGSVLYGLGRQRIIAVIRGVEGVANLVLSVLLVQPLGVIGVALGTVIPHLVVALVVLPLAIRRVLGIGLREYYLSTFLRPYLAAVPFTAACLVVDRVVAPASLKSFIALAALALLTYAVPCWFVALTAREREMAAARLSALLGRSRPARLDADRGVVGGTK